MNRMPILLLILSFLINGCSTTSVYKEVFKEKPIHNSKEFTVYKDILYQATIRTVCSKNFIIEREDEDKGFILAKRSFQKGKRTIVLALQAKIDSDEENKSSTLYLNALQTTERLFIADHTRFFLFVIPLPGGGGKEATVIKEGEKIVKDKKFYKKFFSAIEEQINALTAKDDKEK